ncbi:TonB-dependent receptor-like protein [Flavobacteriaceae bacterium MAR_2010_72]|nr:TonB-dependent receptor-like protein [Flavobacteriaceae bacterium MAR_2010_72]TVZ58138.1 TonB-dependent receptor-like protein [Flavobacteriaceae bacterium MAR_2010_105]
MRITSRLVVLILIFIASVEVQAQENAIPLTQLIELLQERYKVQFNYAEDLVQEIIVQQPNNSLSLERTLDYLEQQTNLLFTILDDGIILVSLKAPLTLCGYLNRNDNISPLPLTSVKGQFHSAISDENGFFSLKVYSQDETVTIQHLGFKTISKPYKNFDTEDCNMILMEFDFETLSEVILPDYIINGINKLNNGSFEIDFSNFGILPGLIETDVLHSVQAFPGILSSNETVSNINIRGGTHDQNLILWDDIKMYQSGHFFGLISMYNPHITQKVTLNKNGTGASQTDGTSGSIAMYSDQDINTKLKGSIGVNFTNVNGFVDIPLRGKSSLQVAARTSINDIIETPTYKAFFDRISQNTEVDMNNSSIVNSDKTFDFYDTSLRWLYAINENNNLRLNFINVNNALQFNENAKVDDVDVSRESRITQNSIAGGVEYQRQWNEKFQTTFEIYETDYKLKAINVNLDDSQRFLQENIVSETSLKLKADNTINKTFDLLSGYHFVETEVTNLDDVDDPLYRLLVSEVVRTHALFSQIGYKSLTRNTFLNFGVRANYIDKFKKLIFEPRLSFSQRFLNNFTFEVLGEFKHQNTSQVINFQNDFLGIEKRRWQLSNNEDIPVITSKQISVGLDFSRKGWLISAEGFYKRVDGITSQSQGFQNQYEFVRTDGRYSAKGIDVLFRKRINKFNSWLSYSFMDNQYTFESLKERRFPSNFDISHAITFGTAYTGNRIKLSAGLNWHTGKPTTQPEVGNEIVGNEINYESTNSSNLDDYLRVDISALYNLKLGQKTRLNIGVSIWNILDKKNIINNFYRIDNNSINNIEQRSLGLTPNATISIHFN